MYSNTALTNWIMAMIAAPKANDPVWYLIKKHRLKLARLLGKIPKEDRKRVYCRLLTWWILDNV